MNTTKNKTKKLQAAVYVGTYAKYNNGSIEGGWLKLSNYNNKDSFIEACRKLHKDESDPELMFQDFEYIPCSMIGESWIEGKFWDYINLVDDYLDADIIQAAIDLDIEPENIEDAFSGQYDDDESFAIETAEACGFEEPSVWPYNCINWEQAARDLMYDYSEWDGFYFRNF